MGYMAPTDEPNVPGPARVVLFTARQPPWVLKVALAAGLLVFTGVLALLIIPATVVALVIFFSAAAIVGVTAWVRGAVRNPRTILHPGEGRENVRIKSPSE